MRSRLPSSMSESSYPLLRFPSFPLISLLNADGGKNLLTQGADSTRAASRLGNEPPNSDECLPRLHGGLQLSASVPWPLPCPSLVSPFPVPHGRSVSQQDHAPLGAPEPRGGSGSLHDHQFALSSGGVPSRGGEFPSCPNGPQMPHVLLSVPPGAVTLGDSENTCHAFLAPQDTHPPAGEGQDASLHLSPGYPGCSSDISGPHIPGPAVPSCPPAASATCS